MTDTSTLTDPKPEAAPRHSTSPPASPPLTEGDALAQLDAAAARLDEARAAVNVAREAALEGGAAEKSALLRAQHRQAAAQEAVEDAEAAVRVAQRRAIARSQDEATAARSRRAAEAAEVAAAREEFVARLRAVAVEAREGLIELDLEMSAAWRLASGRGFRAARPPSEAAYRSWRLGIDWLSALAREAQDL